MRGITVGGELISHQLAVLPDTNHIWDEQDRFSFLDIVASWFGDIDFDIVADSLSLACSFASALSQIYPCFEAERSRELR
jgi:hypothetical protein